MSFQTLFVTTLGILITVMVASQAASFIHHSLALVTLK